MTELKIEKNIPVPEIQRLNKSKLHDMEIGDSIGFVGIEAYLRAKQNAYNFGRRTGTQFTGRKDGDGGRIWRVE